MNTQLFSSQNINWWTVVVLIIVLFLLTVWALIMTAPIQCWGSIGEQVNATFLKIYFKLFYILGGLRINNFVLENVNFWVKHSFNSKQLLPFFSMFYFLM